MPDRLQGQAGCPLRVRCLPHGTKALFDSLQQARPGGRGHEQSSSMKHPQSCASAWRQERTVPLGSMALRFHPLPAVCEFWCK